MNNDKKEGFTKKDFQYPGANYSGPPLFGSTKRKLIKIIITRTDENRNNEVYSLENLQNGTLSIRKNKAGVEWKSSNNMYTDTGNE